MQIALNPHAAQLLPALDRIHRRPAVGIAVDEAHRRSVEIERELRHRHRRVAVAAGPVRNVGAVGERIRRIDRARPLHLAGHLVDIVDVVPVGAAARTRRAHKRKMTAGGKTHDSDAVRIKSARRRSLSHHAYRALGVLPGGRMLGERRGRTGRPVGYDHHRHALGVEIFGDRQPFAGNVAVAVRAAGRDDLDRLGFEVFRDEPFDERNGLLLILDIGSFALGPDVLFHPFGGVKTGEDTALLQGLLTADEPHLLEEFLGADEPVVVSGRILFAGIMSHETVVTVGVKMEFGGNFHAAQLTVYLRGAVGRIKIDAAVEEAHGAGFRIELERFVEFDVDRVAVAGIGAGKPVVERIGRIDRNRPVDVTGKRIKLIDRFVGGSLRRSRKHHRQMGTGGKTEHADLLRIEAELSGARTHKLDRPLTVLPAAPVDRRSFRTRSAVDERNAAHAHFGQTLGDAVDPLPVAAAVVTAAGNENHARVRADVRRRSVVPVEIRHNVLRRLEAGRGRLFRGGGDLMRLQIRNFSFRPYILPLARERRGREKSRKNQNCFFHFAVFLLLSV